MIVDDDIVPCTLVDTHIGAVEEVPDLNLRLEEADQRMIPHIKWCLTQSIKNVIVISSDTDVLVLLIHNFSRFKSEGLQKMWLRIEKKEAQRFIPIHTVTDKLGPSITQVLLKAHLGTGCDYLSKIGTKHGALKASPEKFLQSFGEGDILTDDQIIKAEQYLVKVLKYNSEDLTLDKS